MFLTVLAGCGKRQAAAPTPQMDADLQFWVRVLLLDDCSDCTLGAPCDLTLIDPQRQTTLARVENTQEPLNLRSTPEGIVVGPHLLHSPQIIFHPDSPYVFQLNGRPYRGRLMLTVNDDRTSFDAVNIVPLEPYLAGVIGAEMPDYWEPAALRAQTVAARTYCMFMKQRFGPKRTWDVRRTQANQVYLGMTAESGQVWDAVNKTAGQVLVCAQPDGSQALFPAYYSSTCGGHTENSRNVFGDSFGPLAGVPCPYCMEVARPAFYFWATAQFDKTTVTKKLIRNYPSLKELRQITGIVAVKQSNYGRFARLTSVKLIGSTGKSRRLEAENLRLTIDPTGRKIRSTICKIEDAGDKWSFKSGRGYGHGVGMCQCGAQAMARQAINATQILMYYYPHSKIISLYDK
jgi:stage II sporulation protein D